MIKEYIDFSDALALEVKDMSGLGESVFLEGLEQGIRELVLKLNKKMNIEQISEVTEFTIEEIKEILSYDEDNPLDG